MMKRVKDIINYNQPVLLMSLHPPYVKQIENETKVIEYRKSFYKNGFQAFVYTTGVKGGIELFIKCSRPMKGKASQLAKMGAIIQNDDYQSTYHSFGDKKQGVMIPIIQIVQMKKLSKDYLYHHFSNFSAPQSYLFLDKKDKIKILNALENDEVISVKNVDWNDRDKSIEKLLN